MKTEARARLEHLLAGARKLADPQDSLGREARVRLTRSSGLSAANVEWALTHALESHPSEEELEALAASVVESPRSHVLLSANVFVAAHRAIALALVASAEVFVRPSRREPEMSELLATAAPGLFQLVGELDARDGDQLFAYGHAETLREVQSRQAAGVLFHGHGPGFGLVALSAEAIDDAERLANDLSIDLAAFDQRGCLSPRLLLMEGSRTNAIAFAERLAAALTRIERDIPLGELSPEERAEVTRYRDTLAYSGELFPAGRGYVGVAPSGAPVELAPIGRNLHVLATDDASALIQRLAPGITTFAFAGAPEREAELRALLPAARRAHIGHMQTPAFDGPVDLRGVKPRA
ncbi:MAG: acyl-CoA reductase [Myxococcota bacterium]